jgi:hypothetical protein
VYESEMLPMSTTIAPNHAPSAGRAAATPGGFGAVDPSPAQGHTDGAGLAPEPIGMSRCSTSVIDEWRVRDGLV